MKKLPTIGTSAPSTAFCAARVDGPDGLFLWVDGNGKITRGQGDLDHPVPNAFSLPSQGVEDTAGRRGSHCPGATPSCLASCYVDGLAKHASATYDLYRHNAETIRTILFDDFREEQFADAWAMTFAEWIAAHCATFRWHVSGDVFGYQYAAWIADVCRETPDVEHWIYTRSFDFLEPLAAVSTLRGGNLALNLSCDRDNYGAAALAADKHGFHGAPLRLCYLTTDEGAVPYDLPDGSVIFPDYALRGGTEAGRAWFGALDADYKSFVCPVDFHGKAENRRCGPCARCLT